MNEFGVEGVEKMHQAVGPVSGGLDALEQVDQQDQRVVDAAKVAAVGWSVEICVQMRRLLLRQLKGDDKLAVPRRLWWAAVLRSTQRWCSREQKYLLIQGDTRQRSPAGWRSGATG